MSKLVNDRVEVNLAEPEEPTEDSTTHNVKKCKKDFDWDNEKSDEHASHEENTWQRSRRTNRTAVRQERMQRNKTPSECGMCHNSITKDVVIIRKAKTTNW